MGVHGACWRLLKQGTAARDGRRNHGRPGTQRRDESELSGSYEVDGAVNTGKSGKSVQAFVLWWTSNVRAGDDRDVGKD